MPRQPMHIRRVKERGVGSGRSPCCVRGRGRARMLLQHGCCKRSPRGGRGRTACAGSPPRGPPSRSWPPLVPLLLRGRGRKGGGCGGRSERGGRGGGRRFVTRSARRARRRVCACVCAQAFCRFSTSTYRRPASTTTGKHAHLPRMLPLRSGRGSPAGQGRPSPLRSRHWPRWTRLPRPRSRPARSCRGAAAGRKTRCCLQHEDRAAAALAAPTRKRTLLPPRRRRLASCSQIVPSAGAAAGAAAARPRWRGGF